MAATDEVLMSYVETTTCADSDEWKKSIVSELESLTANKTWKLVPRPAHQRPIGCHWVFPLKRDEKGQMIRRKDRLVAKRFLQKHGIDYKETYAPVAYLNLIRAKLAKCGADRFEIERCDIDTAFLNGKLNEEIYMELLEGQRELLALAEAEGSDGIVCLLLQSLNGLKQGYLVWNETIDKHLKVMDCKAADADPSVYTKDEGDDECIVCLYVDDMLIAAKNKATIASAKAGIAEKLKLKDFGCARFVLRIKIDYNMEGRTLRISQKVYTESIIKKFRQESAQPCLTPLEAGIHLTKADQPQTEHDKAKMSTNPNRSLVGSFEVPGMWVVRYVLKTKDVAITYDGRQGTELVAYSDADWAGNRDDRRSVSGLMLMMSGAPVLRRSAFQTTVALSSTEAEYMALRDCVKEVVQMRLLLKDIGSGQDDGTVIYEDNQGVMALAKNVGYQARTKHIDVRYHFIREKITSGEGELESVNTKNQLADYLRKILSTKTLRYLVVRSNVGSKLETSN
ncbi:hypothetical protein PC110_g19674 [Phytophthora cactorum]|uniref:Reverse transcriptase Ty1/copia-type domain-containing protein n=1 Tax=Phytophthora cactorum TaxID=29920 RepID=A0A329RHJ3_9STRA|nr:hypothetical protein PC110_g19674 [Phytophthora cactorum]